MILTLLPGPQDETMMPPPISTLKTPYASTPSCLKSLCSRGALNPPYASTPPPLTILTLLYYIHSVRWLVGVHNQCNQGNMLSGLLCQQDLMGNWSVYSQCCG
ncbi:hypothetical protein O181_125200 [Austropuccinia psidii MF-1]|uniref:Uncharacterized protein n=1 Tax=Austropuccinia psidii MF-1 TaxID=1389203 RepID=A0A9Q3Q5W1_9BASI|nr:hypothetical protein [Austropuccinia psidii MF-1]